MYRNWILTGLVAVGSFALGLTASASDSDAINYPSCRQCITTNAHVYVVVNYTGLTPNEGVRIYKTGANILVNFTTDADGNGTYNEDKGIFDCGGLGYGSDANWLDYRFESAGYTVIGGSIPGSGGRWLTYTMTDGSPACPGSCPSTGTNTVTLTYNLGGSFHRTLTADGTVTGNNCTDAHTLELKINGVSVGFGSTSGNGSPNQTGGVHFVSGDDYTGQSYEWLVDGVSAGGGTISYQTDAEGHIWCTLNFSQAFDCVPSPSPTPSASPTPHTTPTPFPTPTATPSNPPGTTPFPTAPPGSTPDVVTSGTGQHSLSVIVQNPQDIYQPILDGLKVTGDIPAPDINLDGADMSDEGEIARATTATGEMRDRGMTAAQDAEDTIISGREKILALLEQLESPGSEHVIDVEVPSAGGLWDGYTWHIDLSDWSAAIAILRLFVLVCCAITYGILTLRALTYQN